MSRLGTETAFDVLVRARELERQGRSIIHLELGEPDFATPAPIIAAATRAMENGWTKYGPSAGLPQLREAIAADVSRRRRISVTPDEVVVTPGAKPIIFFSILALVDPGDEVIYPNPGFPIYESMISFVGARPVPIPLREERDFSLDVEEVIARITPRTALIILNSPHNPTGGVMSAEDMQALAEAVCDRDVMILSDEIYSRIVFEGEHLSIAQFPGMREKTIILDGFSKTFSMTGWRLGYGVMPVELARQVTKLQTNSTSCTTSFIQIAGVEALTGDQSPVEQMVAEFRRRRDVIVAGLNAIEGFSCRVPKGAFYVFPNITGTGWSSKKLADYLLETAGVACVAGTAFGAYGEGYIRFSFANSVENIKAAVERVRDAVAALRIGAAAS
jgi:aspartate/methionine/tyrosine aminotransferase